MKKINFFVAFKRLQKVKKKSIIIRFKNYFQPYEKKSMAKWINFNIFHLISTPSSRPVSVALTNFC